MILESCIQSRCSDEIHDFESLESVETTYAGSQHSTVKIEGLYGNDTVPLRRHPGKCSYLLLHAPLINVSKRKIVY